MSDGAVDPGVRLVLVRPRTGGNVGAVARALKNFGLSDWVLVDPQVEDWSEAAMMAVQAEDVLAARRTASTWDEAVADCAWVVGTTSRARRGLRRWDPQAFADEALERSAQGRVALVFGDERSGLTNDELDRCHDVTTLGTDDAQPSVNLAQAVMLYSWELMRARRRVGPPKPPTLPIAATEDDLRAVEAALEALLRGKNVLHGEGRHLVGDLCASLRRGRLTRKEARLWTSALRGAVKFDR